jgi:hypothetical protein
MQAKIIKYKLIINPLIRAKFKYLGMPLTNGSDIHIAINDSLNFRNPCYHSVHNLLPSIYKTIISSKWVDNIKIDFREMGWTGSIWLRIGTSGGLL